MQAVQKSLDQLAKRAPGLHSSSKSTSSPTVHDSIDSLITQLEASKAALSSADPAVLAAELRSSLDSAQRNIADRQKEFYAALSKASKALDKKFPSPVDAIADPSLFSSPESQRALAGVVLQHLLRDGDWEGARLFASQAGIPIPPHLEQTFTQLHAILRAISAGDLGPAIAWAQRERAFLNARQSPLEFALHRSQFIRIASGAYPHLDPNFETTNITKALAYARANFQPFLERHLPEIQRMLTLLAFLPAFELPESVPVEDLLPGVPPLYQPLLDQRLVHATFLEPLFRLEYSSRNRIAKEAPLNVGVEIGAGGALSHILKAKTIMRERKNEWSQADELPIEIPVPPQLRFHSVFACPVSKEQATEDNPPMMLVCGHVFCRETINKMAKGGGRFKCSYCPTESSLSQAIRVYF